MGSLIICYLFLNVFSVSENFEVKQYRSSFDPVLQEEPKAFSIDPVLKQEEI